jgi:hypothetical protein
MWQGVVFDSKGTNGDIFYSVVDKLGEVSSSRISSGNSATSLYCKCLLNRYRSALYFAEIFDTEAGSVSSSDQQQLEEMKVLK